MARGLLNIAGGLLSGIGQGMVKQEEQAQKRGMEEREARRRELERQQDQGFRQSERIAGQDFQAQQAEVGREQAERLQTQRLEAEKEQRRQEREAQANDPLRQAQAEYYRGGGAAGQRMLPVEIDDPDNPGQRITVYKPAGQAAGGEVGARPQVGKPGPAREELYAKAAKIVDERNANFKTAPRDEKGNKITVTDDVRRQMIEAEIAAMRGETAPAKPTSPQPSAAPPGAAPRTDPAEVQRLRARAQQAISAGGDAAAVRQRFKELTGQEL